MVDSSAVAARSVTGRIRFESVKEDEEDATATAAVARTASATRRTWRWAIFAGEWADSILLGRAGERGETLLLVGTSSPPVPGF